MTPTAYFKNNLKNARSIFKWDLKRCAGSLTVYSLLSGVAIAIVLTIALVFGTGVATGSSFNKEVFDLSIKIFQSVSTVIVTFVTIVFTITYTINVFSYLHNKRKTDMFGSLPVSRTALFCSKALSGYLFSVVPAAVFIGIILLISACLGCAPIPEVINILVQMLLGTAACVSFYGLLSVCCGTTLNSVITFIVICVAYPLSAMFIKGIIGSFFFGLSSSIYNKSFIMEALNPLAAYDGDHKLYWFLFTAVCVAVSIILVKRRKADRAQTSFAFYLPCHIVKLLAAFITGMFIGCIFGTLNVFGFGYAGFVFGFILGSVPAFIIAHLIFYKGFSRLLKTAAPLGVMAAAVIALMAFCEFDVFGFTRTAPQVQNIESAGLVDSEDCFINTDYKENVAKLFEMERSDFTDAASIQTIQSIHDTVVKSNTTTSQKKYSNIWQSILLANMPVELDTGHYCVSYKLKDGSTLDAYLPKYTAAVDFIGAMEIDDAEKITNTAEYYKKYGALFNIDNSKIELIDICSVWTDEDDSVLETDIYKRNGAENIEKIVEALKQDILNSDTGLINRYDSDEGLFEINITYAYENGGDTTGLFSELFTSWEYHYINSSEHLIVTEDCTRTLKVLRDLGYIDAKNKPRPDHFYSVEYAEG